MRRLTRERFLSDAELAAFMGAVRERRHVHQPRDYAFFSLLANTGIRPREAMRLTLADVHMAAAFPWIYVEREHPQYAPEPVKELIINKAVAAIVRDYVATMPKANRSARLFPFTKRQSARLYHYYARKAAVTPPRKIYALRHTSGKRLWRYTHDLRLIQAIMGHVRLKATRVYAEPDSDAVFAAQSTLECV